MKLLFEYKYGKPEDVDLREGRPKVNINIKNLFAGNQDQSDDPDIIDVTEEE